MRKTVKKLVSILGGLLLLTILTVSCNGWMQDDGFMENIEDEVSVANADRIATYVRYPNTKMGTTSPSGDAILKVNVPMDITATTNTEYGFYKWAAFKKGTDEGEFDTSKQNSSLYYKSVEYYEENYAQYELPSSVVEFVDPTAESTSVKIKEKRNDVVIVPIVVERPFYTASVPANGKSDVVLNQAIRILMSKAISGEKLAENIKITAGTAVFTEDTEDSDAEDITDRFDITLSKTGKMITCKLKSTDGENKILMPTKSQITVTIYSDLKDTLGYTMEENQKIIFQTGSVTDTLAPKYVDNPKAGINELAKDFVFMGPKGSREALDSIFATTFNEYKTIFKDGSKYLKPLEDSSYAADTKDEDAKFVFTNYLRHRVYDKLNIVVRAADLAGSGTKADEQSAVEDDVAFIKIRSKLVRDANNTPVTTEYSANGTIGYQAGGIDKSDDYAYKGNLTLAQATGAEEGTLFTYNLDSLLDADKNTYKLTDGLVRIDLWTVDMIGNEGKDDNYWSNWDNGIRTLYVVKDQTPPVITTSSITSGSAAITASQDTGNKAYAAVSNNWYNPITFKNIKIAANAANAVVDPGYVDPTNPEINYAAYKNDLQWTIKINPAEDWNPATETTSWKKIYITSDSKNNVTDYEKYDFTNASVSADGVVNIKVAAKDDLGNVSAPVALGSVYYDHVTPSLGQVSWTGIDGATAGCTNKNVLDNQILNIPFVEATSGIQTVKLEILEDGKQSSYQTPFASNDLKITYGGNTISNYNVSGDTITFAIQNEQNHTYFTTGTLSIQGIKIADTITEGSYKVSVTITDGAQNAVKKSDAEFIYVDKTVPVVEKIEIPGLKKAKELSTQTLHGPDEKYWIDSSYIGGDCNDNYDPTKLAVYLTITEDNSGVRKIILGGTTNVQSGTTVYKVDDNGNETQFAGIEIDSTENSIKITDVLQAFKGSTSFKIAIKNLKGVRAAGDASSPTANTVKVKLIDVAENVSTEASTMKVKDTETVIDGFYSDSWHCGLETVNLVDRDGSGNTTATSGYTNDEIVNLTISMGYEDKNASGHNRFVLTGATFITEEPNKTVVTFKDVPNSSSTPTSASGGTVLTDYEISTDKKTITFKNNDAYLVFRHRTCIEFKNVKLDTTTDGSKDVAVQAFDLAGWDYPESANKSSSIILDKTKPEWRYDIFSSSTDKYTTGTVGTNVYPHPNGESAKGINITGKTNGDGNAVSYFYTSAKIGDDYGAVLGIPCKDDTQLRGYKGNKCVSYVVYEHADSATATMNAATVIAYGTIPTSDVNSNKTGSDSGWKTEFNGWTFFEAGKTYSIVVLDEAGNYSEKAQTVTIVQDTTPPVTTNVQKAMYLNAPENTKVFRNETSETVTYDSSSSYSNSKNLFWDDPKSNGNSHSTPKLQVIKYVIKDTSNLSDSYKIVIPFGSGRANDTIGLDGLNSTSVSTSDLAKTTVTASAAPLESYSISHWYGNWKAESASTDDYRPSFPTDTKSPTSDNLETYLNGLYGYSTGSNSSHVTYKAAWHPYLTDRGTVYTDGDSAGASDTYHKVSSKVNDNGDIVIYLNKSKTTEPLSLLLRDGCGNLNYVLVKPYTEDATSELGKFHVSWTVDNEFGSGESVRHVGMNPFMGASSTESGVVYEGDGCSNPAYDVAGNTVADRKYYGYQTSPWRPNKIGPEDGQSVLGTLMRDVKEKVTYYNNNAYIGLFNNAESCKYTTKSTKSSDFGDSKGYTVRARIRAWDKDAEPPEQKDFIGPGTIGGEGTDFSSWYYLRDTISSGHNEYTLQYPHPTSRTVPYKLYYYVEDAVGNYEINTIVNSNSDTDMVYWMYDNAGPSVLTRSGKKDPSTITGTYINDLVATNNGYRPYFNPSNNYGYIVKTTTQRSGYSLPGKDLVGRGVSIGAIGNKLKWGSYFDLDITETSGIRAFTYSTSKIANPSSLPVGAGSMGDSTTTKWYAGKDSSSGSEVDNAIDKEIGSSVTYPTSLSSEKIITRDSSEEVSHDYYKPDYGASKYSGVKVCETIPYGLVNTTAIDTLYLYLMDWVGNITEVKLGDGIKWINDAAGPGNDGSTTTAIYNDDYYIASYNNSYNLKYTYAATKSSISDASAIKVYMPATKYKDSGSGIYGWSRTQNKVTDVKTDVNGSYFEVNTDELALIKNGKTNSDLDIYVYDNVGCCNKVIVSLAGDDKPIKPTLYVRAEETKTETKHGPSYYYNPDSATRKTDYRASANLKADVAVLDNITDMSQIKTTVYIKNDYLAFLPNFGTELESDFYNAAVQKWDSSTSKWVVDKSDTYLGNSWQKSENHEDATYYEGGNTYFTTLFHTVSSDGYYRFMTRDKAGNVSYSYIKVVQDKTAPQVNVDSSSIQKVNQVGDINYFTTGATVNVQYSDTGSGLKEIGANQITTYETDITQNSVNLCDQTINLKKIQFSAKDNVDNGGTVNLTYNGVSDWVKDTDAPTYTPITNQSAVKKGKKNVSDTTYSTSGTNRNFTFENCNYNKQASLYCTYNTDTKITNLIVNPQVYKFTFKLPSITDDNFYGWKVSDSSITDTWFNAETGGQVNKYESGYSFYRNSMGGVSGTQVIPENGTSVYFYPIDKAGNIGTPIILSFVMAPLPVIESITPTDTVNNYYNANSKVNVKAKYSWGSGEMPIIYIGISDENDNYQLIDVKTQNVKLSNVGDTYTFAGLPLNGITGSNIDFEIITDLTSSEVKQLNTINYDGTGPSSIKINSVSNQTGGTYVVKEDDASITYGTNASTITITPSSDDQAKDATHPIQYSSDNSTWGDTAVFTTFTGTQKIYAKDGLGNVSELVITFTLDATAPTISSVTDNSDSVTKAYRSSDTVYFASGCGNISFTVNSSDSDIRGYKMDTNDEQTSSSFSITPAKNGETHTFYAIDKVGNVSAGKTITFTEDNTVPATPTITFDYNQYVYPSILTDTAIDTSKTYYFNGNEWQTGFAVKVQSSDTAGSGLASVVISGQSGNNGSYVLNPEADKEVEYTVIATDNVGHTAESKFKLYNKKTGPVPTTGSQNVTYTSLSGANGIKAISNGTGYEIASGTLTQVRENTYGLADYAYLYSSGTTFNIPVTDSIGTVSWAITGGNTVTAYTAPSSSSYNSATITDGKITVTLPGITTANSYLFLWVKDEVGNENKYNIGNPSNPGQNWLSQSATIGDYSVSVSGSVITISGLAANYAIKSIKITSDGGDLFSGENHEYTLSGDSNNRIKFTGYTKPVYYQSTENGTEFTIALAVGGEDSNQYAKVSYIPTGGTITITAVDNGGTLNVSKVSIEDHLGNSKEVTLTNNSYTPAANVNGSIAGRTLSGLKELFTPKSRKSTSTSSIAPTAATTTTAPKTKATKTKKSKAAKAPVVQELPTESFAEMPALESVDVLGALERSSNANSSVDGIAAAGKAVEIVKQQAENLTAEPKAAASGVMGSETHAIESSEADKRNVLPIIIILGVCLSLGLVFAFFMTKKKNTRS